MEAAGHPSRQPLAGLPCWLRGGRVGSGRCLAGRGGWALAAEYARQGKDWETELYQRAKEVSLMKELELTAEQTAPKDQTQEDAKEDDEEIER